MTSHYNKQTAHLEALVHSKRNQLALLDREHMLLRQKEACLQNAIRSIEGPLSLVTATLAGAAPKTPTPSAAEATAVGAAAAAATAGAEWSPADTSTRSTSSSSLLLRSVSLSSSGHSTAQHGRSHSFDSHTTRLTVAAYKDSAAMLQRVNAREVKVQKVLQRLGCCDSAGYRQLYTSWLLQRAVSEPERVAQYVLHTKTERMQFWAESHKAMALLLGKYDSDTTLSTGNVRGLLDGLVDELLERVVLCGLIDPPQLHLGCSMYNVDTHDFEQYPPRYWVHVAKGMGLTSEQQAVLKLAYHNFKAGSDKVTHHLEGLLQQLQQLHARQLQKNKEFESMIQQLPALMRTIELTRQARQEERKQQPQQQQQQQQQQQAPELHVPQQRPQPREPLSQLLLPEPLPPPQQQQQQQQHMPLQRQQTFCSLQQVQQQQQLLLQLHRQQQPLQELHASWQNSADMPAALSAAAAAATAVTPAAAAAAAAVGGAGVGSGGPARCNSEADQFIAELAAELEVEHQLQQQVRMLLQQQEHGLWGNCPMNIDEPAPPPPAAAAAAVTSPHGLIEFSESDVRPLEMEVQADIPAQQPQQQQVDLQEVVFGQQQQQQQQHDACMQVVEQAPLAAGPMASRLPSAGSNSGSFLVPHQQQQQQQQQQGVSMQGLQHFPAAAGPMASRLPSAGSTNGSLPIPQAPPAAAAAVASQQPGQADLPQQVFAQNGLLNPCRVSAAVAAAEPPQACRGSFLLSPAAAAAAAKGSFTAPALTGCCHSAAAASAAVTAAGVVNGRFSAAAAAAEGVYTRLEEAEEVLLQVGSEERQNLESRLRSEVNKLKVLIYCLQLQLLNTCSKKQLAAMCVHSHPFCFDAAAICQAAAELLEQQQQRQQENCSNV